VWWRCRPARSADTRSSPPAPPRWRSRCRPLPSCRTRRPRRSTSRSTCRGSPPTSGGGSRPARPCSSTLPRAALARPRCSWPESAAPVSSLLPARQRRSSCAYHRRSGNQLPRERLRGCRARGHGRPRSRRGVRLDWRRHHNEDVPVHGVQRPALTRRVRVGHRGRRQGDRAPTVLFGNFSLCGVCHAYVGDPRQVKRAIGHNFPAHADGERVHARILELTRHGRVRPVIGQEVAFIDCHRPPVNGRPPDHWPRCGPVSKPLRRALRQLLLVPS
jgi:hypothetical protein